MVAKLPVVNREYLEELRCLLLRELLPSRLLCSTDSLGLRLAVRVLVFQ